MPTCIELRILILLAAANVWFLEHHIHLLIIPCLLLLAQF